MIHESQKGAVYLERIPDRKFQAAHPIKLEPSLLARVLRGVHVQDEKGTIQTLFAAQPKAVPAFSEEEVAFLASLIATALTQAAPDQRVGFRVSHLVSPSYSQTVGAGVGSSEPPLSLSQLETTSGTIYAHGLSLHLTLTQYRHRPQRPDTISSPNRYYPDPTGLNRRDVTFVPEAARRPDTYRQSSLLADPDLTTLVIDYELLAKLPAQGPALPASTAARSPVASPSDAAAPAEQAAPTAEELQSVKELIIKKDMELEALKEELRSLRRQLTEQEAEPQKSKGRRKPAPHSQEASP
jgi:hypothetical protein